MDEPTSKYCVQVLRKTIGDHVLLTDGNGSKYEAEIIDDHRKRCVLNILNVTTVPPSHPQLTIAIAFTKNASRIEWFLEKAVEIGVQNIIPLITHRTEKEKLKVERLESILVSAMLQSQQSFITKLAPATTFNELVQSCTISQKFIAHCLPESKQFLLHVVKPAEDAIILIGPEGDFTPQEIELALQQQFTPVSLGNTRLRTETAGVVAATLLAAKNVE